MEDRDYLILLYDYYGELFNNKQKEYFELYYFDNLSLGEISENLNISRNAVHKMVKFTENKLLFYEKKLKFFSKSNKILDVVKDISDDELRDKIINILKEE